MLPKRKSRLVGCALLGLSISLAAQDEGKKLQESLIKGGLAARVEAARALAAAPDKVWNEVVITLGGTGANMNHRVKELVQRLGDDRYSVREKAQRDLVLLGRLALPALKKAEMTSSLLEVRWRAARATKDINKATASVARTWQRRIAILRATAWALAICPPTAPARRERAQEVLNWSIADQDQVLCRESAFALARLGNSGAIPVLVLMVETGQSGEALAAISALGRIGSAPAKEALIKAVERNKSDLMCLAAWTALGRPSSPEKILQGSDLSPLLSQLPPLPIAEKKETWQVELVSGEKLTGEIGEMNCNGLVLTLPTGISLSLAYHTLFNLIPQSRQPVKAKPGSWVLLRTGTWLPGKVVSLGTEEAVLELAGLGNKTVKRNSIRAFGFGAEPGLAAALPRQADLLKLTDGRNLEGPVVMGPSGKFRIGEKAVEIDPKQVVLCVVADSFRGRVARSADPLQVLLVSAFSLVKGGCVKGFFVAGDSGGTLVVDPVLGPIALPYSQVQEVEFMAGLGPGISLTLVTEYQDNEVFELDAKGKRVWSMTGLDGPWDAEWLPNGNLLLCEQSGQVREVTRQGKTVWKMTGLVIPYDADFLPNGNYLIADSGNRRVIEVTPKKEIVWQFKGVESFDVERLASGNTLIADYFRKRVIEVDMAGKVVWQVKNLAEVYDVDRLVNGNTLIALWDNDNNKVIEVNREGQVVWQLNNVSAPTDVDRLPGGYTLIAESEQLRMVDRRGKTIWQKKTKWAVEVNRY